LRLDHVSIAVPDLREALAQLDARFGLRATVSAADPQHHSRVYLDRAYLEVSATRPVASWEMSLFFLRFDDSDRLREHLQGCGISHRFGRYQGVDGWWDDVELDAGSVPLPILVRRSHPPEIATDWPPALDVPHRCGARTLQAVHVVVPELSAAVDVYRKLLGAEALARTAVAATGNVEFALPAGQIVLSQGAKPGIAAVVIGLPSLAAAAAAVGPLPAGSTAWVESGVLRGARLGFTEI
jgi:catechol 2,3-dioxygenase-like lactoylglutathione lyase family enzyme